MRYALSPYITEIRFVFKGLMKHKGEYLIAVGDVTYVLFVELPINRNYGKPLQIVCCQHLQLVRDLKLAGTLLHWKPEHALSRLLENYSSV